MTMAYPCLWCPLNFGATEKNSESSSEKMASPHEPIRATENKSERMKFQEPPNKQKQEKREKRTTKEKMEWEFLEQFNGKMDVRKNNSTKSQPESCDSNNGQVKQILFSPEVVHKSCSKFEERMKFGTKTHLGLEKSN